MNLEEVGAVLAKAAAFDNRTIGDANLLAWHEVLGDLDVRDCLAAITRHHSESTEYLMPGHVRRLAEQIRKERRDRERSEQRRLALQARAAEGGSLRDRSAEIQAFVSQIRGVLPEGDIEALHSRREFWRREHEAYLRQKTAQPNPAYRPRPQEAP